MRKVMLNIIAIDSNMVTRHERVKKGDLICSGGIHCKPVIKKKQKPVCLNFSKLVKLSQ